MRKSMVVAAMAVCAVWFHCLGTIGPEAGEGSDSTYWSADTVLGEGFDTHRFDMGTDYSGKVVSTLIRHRSECGDSVGVLYVHGFNDYFFQKDEAERFADSCYHFYAVDLRKYGRSILPGQKVAQVRDLKEYFPDIDSALMVMKRDGIKEVMLMGHSTGGLVTSYYMSEQPDSVVKSLVLNSPFLEWNMGWAMRKVAVPFVGWLGRFFPGMSISTGGGSGYGESLLKDYHGEWEFNTDWKSITPRKVEFSWLNAISRGQKQVRGNRVKVPVLLMHSSESVSCGDWNEKLQHGDAVLNVDDMKKYGPQLGPDVWLHEVPGGMHDLFLSAEDAREDAYEATFKFLRDVMR